MRTTAGRIESHGEPELTLNLKKELIAVAEGGAGAGRQIKAFQATIMLNLRLIEFSFLHHLTSFWTRADVVLQPLKQPPLRVHQQQTFMKATVLEEDFYLKINLEESR